MTRVLYSSDGAGKWWRTEWSPRCEQKLIFTGQCQGTLGHDDVHWAFMPSGGLEWLDNDDDPRHNGASGVTPPEHKLYLSPSAMSERYHLKFKTYEEVSDPALIKLLEAGEDPPEPHASVSRPLNPDDPFYEEAKRRYEAFKNGTTGDE